MPTPGREYRFGPHYLGDDQVRFRFWAPPQKRVMLELKDRPLIAMNMRDGGWFEAEAECHPGAPYRFRLDDGIAVPDPASRAQEGDVHGWSVVVDPNAYRWQHQEWAGRPWHEAVIYELHAGLLGGFAGVQQILPRLLDLGITAVELMPIADFPGKCNWGYDGVLPFAPDAAYGTPNQLKSLIDAAHDLGLMMFLDVVYNHFGPDGNYLHHYVPQLFHADRHTGWGSALDFKVPELRRFFTENAIYWLNEYRFDGLRFDAVHAVGERDWLEETEALVRGAVGVGRHVHLVLENDHNDARLLRDGYDAQWNDDGHHALHVLLTGETDRYYADYADRGAEWLARSLKDGFAYQGEPSPYRKGVPRGEPSADLPPTAFVLFLQNHDQIGNRAYGDRLTALVTPDAIEASLALLLLCPQIPMLFMGEEDASPTPFLFFTDHRGDLAEAVRKGRRQELGLAATAPAPPDPNADDTFLASIPRPDPTHAAERFAFIKRLLTIRHEQIVPWLEGTRATKSEVFGPSSIKAEWLRADGRALVIATNLSAEPVRLAAPDGELLFESKKDGVRNGKLQARVTIAWLCEPS
jgi:maltooligosyltrehalose trehalohydrolase